MFSYMYHRKERQKTAKDTDELYDEINRDVQYSVTIKDNLLFRPRINIPPYFMCPICPSPVSGSISEESDQEEFIYEVEDKTHVLPKKKSVDYSDESEDEPLTNYSKRQKKKLANAPALNSQKDSDHAKKNVKSAFRR